MIIKLSFLDGQGKTKNKVYKRQQGQGLEAIKSQFIKYDRWKTCDFMLYYLDQKGQEVILTNDRQLEIYLETNKSNPKIWAKQCQPSKRKEEQFELLKISEIKINEAPDILDDSQSLPNESVIINRNEPPLLHQPKDIQRSQYAQNYQTQQDKLLYRKVMKKNIHLDIHCANCQNTNIQGVRYQCLLCFAFNLCEQCESSPEFQHEHPLLKISRPEKVFTVKQLQQIRDNISAQIPEEENRLEEDQREGYLRRINELTSDYEVLLRELQLSMQQNQQQKTTKQRKQVKKQRQQDEAEQYYCPLDDPRQFFGEIGSRLGQKVGKITQNIGLHNPRRSSREQHHLDEEDLNQKAQAMSNLIGINFSQSLKFVRSYPKLSIGELIHKYLK